VPYFTSKRISSINIKRKFKYTSTKKRLKVSKICDKYYNRTSFACGSSCNPYIIFYHVMWFSERNFYLKINEVITLTCISDDWPSSRQFHLNQWQVMLQEVKERISFLCIFRCRYQSIYLRLRVCVSFAEVVVPHRCFPRRFQTKPLTATLPETPETCL
jgi:hypothetical protein